MKSVHPWKSPSDKGCGEGRNQAVSQVLHESATRRNIAGIGIPGGPMMADPVANPEFSAALRQIPEAVFTIGLDKRIINMNAGAEALTGFSEARGKGRACWRVLRSELCDSSCPFDRALAEDSTVTNFNVGVWCAGEGTPEPVSVHTWALKDSEGRRVGIIESVRFIGHILQLFDALHDKNEALVFERGRIKTVLDSIGEGILTVDSERRVTSLNRIAQETIGCTAEDAAGQPCDKIFGCEAESCPVCPVLRVMDTGEILSEFETQYHDREGRTVPVTLTVTPLRNTEGDIVGAVEAFRKSPSETVDRDDGHHEVMGKSPRLLQILDLLETIKDSDATIFLRGESGTGKGLFASLIHGKGRRRDGPFMKVSCAALPESLLESELFGHERGAFTGAVRLKPGRFELAHGGTVFLDEIGDLTPATQVKLLRFLQEQEFERVGSNKTIKVDVRIIAAANCELERKIADGRFREDLYYRLNVIPVEVPPLRERREDIPSLVEYNLKRLSPRGRGRVKTVTPEVMSVLMAYDWPGNIRELENVVEHAVICSKTSVVEFESLPPSLRRPRAGVGLNEARRSDGDERAHILDALNQHGWDRSATAASLGIHRSTLWRKMQRMGLNRNL